MKCKKIVAMLGLMMIGTSAGAAMQRLDAAGFDVVYDDSLLGLFGSVISSGNSLLFTPTDFAADSSAASWDLARATISFDIEADAGFILSDASLLSRGDYIMFGEGSKVFAGGQTRVFDYRDPLSESVVAITGSGLADLGERDVVGANWEASSVQSFSGGTTRVRYTLQGLLGANAGSGSDLAFIQQSYLGLSVAVSPVPEAGTTGMLLSGLGILGFLLRRRAH